MVILGIDPGLNVTGYGAILAEGGRVSFLAAGDVRPPRGRPLPERLEVLHRAVAELIARRPPGVIVLEMVYTHSRYVQTAAMMAHARGVVCLVANEHRIPVAEYPPARVKQAITGRGAASKDQVARMVVQWLGIGDPRWSHDATDALALAIAHAHMNASRQHTAHSTQP